MKPNSISGVYCHVEDLGKAAHFYETIGFRRGKEQKDRVTFYVNWFFVTLIGGEKASKGGRGEGTFLCVKVEDIESFYKEVIAAGLKPEGEPKVEPSGNREFVLRDPDGYGITFFQKK